MGVLFGTVDKVCMTDGMYHTSNKRSVLTLNRDEIEACLPRRLMQSA